MVDKSTQYETRLTFWKLRTFLECHFVGELDGVDDGDRRGAFDELVGEMDGERVGDMVGYADQGHRFSI